jgi:aspartate/methionine/tyrosine aminotransferase
VTAPAAAPAALADRMAALSGEGALDVFRRATELERGGRPVVHLELGAPDVDAPPHVVEAAVRALRAGDARYVAPQGLPELREAIADDVRSRGAPCDASQVLVTPSAKTAVFYAMLATVEPGSEVLVPDPGFPIYPSMARFAGGVPVGYAHDAANAPDLDDVERRVTPRTRVLVLNSPGNPTGGALDAAGLARLAALAERHDLVVVTDDIYSRLVYDGGRAPTIAAQPAAAGARSSSTASRRRTR